jgi:hypothetical protein
MRGAKFYASCLPLPCVAAVIDQRDQGTRNDVGGQLFDRKPFVRPSELAKLLRPHFESIIEAVDVTPQIVASISARPLNVVSFGGHGALRSSPAPSLAAPASRLRSPSSLDPTEPPRETAGKPSP